MTIATGKTVDVAFHSARSVVGCVVRILGYPTIFEWAKCNPMDTFNESVGKAKALRRALAQTQLTRSERMEIVAAYLG